MTQLLAASEVRRFEMKQGRERNEHLPENDWITST